MWLISIIWAQGWESLYDSLLVENERIEVLELEQRPLPSALKLESPPWSIESPRWEGLPVFSAPLPAPIQPTRPTWTKRAPLHLTYGLGRFWTHRLALNWGRTRDLNADEGISFTHTSTPVGHASKARWGYTYLHGWLGRYRERSGWEVTYRGGYEQFIFYAPYAERWEGFPAPKKVPDSLRGFYFRQELRAQAYDRERGEVRLITRRLDPRRGAPEWQGLLQVSTSPLRLAAGDLRISAEGFWEGKRLSFVPSALWEKTLEAFQVRLGARLGIGRDSSLRWIAAPLLRVIYTGVYPFIRPYVETQGDLRPITYFAGSEINPYLKRSSELLPFMREWIHGQGGILGEGRGWDYRLAAEYRFVQGSPWFVPEGAAFKLVGMPTFQSWGAIFQMAYIPVPTGLYAEARGAYRQWRAPYPYYSLPPWEIWLRGGYQREEQWSFNLSLYALGRRTLAPNAEARPFVDISWEFHAHILPFLSIFAEMNNLLNQRFYRWHAYIERPLDFRLGIWLKLG